MRRISSLLVTLLALTALTGCFKLDMDLTVNEDDTLDGVVVFAISDELADMAEEDSDVDEEDLPDGATVEEYDEDGFVGQKITLESVSMDELNESFSNEGDTGGPSSWSLTHEGDEYRFTGDMDMTEMASTEEDGLDMSAFMQGAELRVAMTFPGEVTQSNGEVDGSTVVWEPEIGEKNEMTAVAEEDTGLPVILLAVVGGTVLLLLLVLALMLRARSRRSPAQQESRPTPVS